MAEMIRVDARPSLFGCGALNRLPEELKSFEFKRVLVVTDSQIVKSGIIERVVDLLNKRFSIELFDDVPPEPLSTDVDGKKDLLPSDFDALLAVGGGSSMDFAKALSITMRHGGLLEDYEGEGTVPGPVIPVVCIPTTSGTGSQSTQTTVYTVNEVKSGCSSEYIRPVFSIVDPELTMKLPPSVTRNAGYDALMHSVEGFLARPHRLVSERAILYQGSNPFSRGLALEAFRSIWGSYKQAVSEGNDRKAREGMSIGSHLAGLAFSHSGLGLVHALASSLGGMVNAPHGVCLAACTEIGLSYNLKFCEEDLRLLSSITRDKDRPKETTGSAEFFLDKLRALRGDLDLPSRPSELGVRREAARVLLQKTLIQTRRLKTNPRPIDDELLSFIEKGI